jgi:hypothetical protein
MTGYLLEVCLELLSGDRTVDFTEVLKDFEGRDIGEFQFSLTESFDVDRVDGVEDEPFERCLGGYVLSKFGLGCIKASIPFSDQRCCRLREGGRSRIHGCFECVVGQGEILDCRDGQKEKAMPAAAPIRGNSHCISVTLLFQLGETLIGRLSLDNREDRVREPLVDIVGHLGNVATAASVDVVGFVYATSASVDVVGFVCATAPSVFAIQFRFVNAICA